jgi:hypothetical protein
VLGDLERALVDDFEVTDLLDLVAPELDPQRVFLGRREDVEDAAAHGEVTALLDELGAGVTGADEVDHDVGQFASPIAWMQLDRYELAEPWHLRLQQRTHRRDDDRQRAGRGIVRRGVFEPAQHREPLPHRVGARGQPFVRQRLPTRVERDLVGGQQTAQRHDEVLGLTTGTGDRENERGPAGDGGDGEWLQSPGTADRQLVGTDRVRDDP